MKAITQDLFVMNVGSEAMYADLGHFDRISMQVHETLANSKFLV